MIKSYSNNKNNENDSNDKINNNNNNNNDNDNNNNSNNSNNNNLFAINVEVIDRCNCRLDICTFRSREVVTKRAERVQERFNRN